MSQARHPLLRTLTAFTPASTARALRHVARGAHLLMLIAPLLRFFIDFQTYLVTTMRNGGFTEGQKVSRMLIGMGDSVFSNVIPLWITFALIWFFAEWSARIADRQGGKQ